MEATLHRRPLVIASIVIAAALVFAGACAVAAPRADAAAKKPARVKIASVKSEKPGQLTVSVKKAKRAKGYQYRVGTDAKLTKGKKVKASKKRTITFTGLKQGKRYWVKVRAYAKKGKKKLWGKWSKAKSATVKAAPAPDPGPAPDPAPAVSASGESGDCTWTLYSDGSLVVAPKDGASGALGTWTYQSGAPWSQHASDIKRAEFRNGVKASTCRDMFYGCSKLASLDLSRLDTSGAGDMKHMFDGCSNLASLDLSRLKTSSATNMSCMFRDCSKLATLDLSRLDTSGVGDMTSMFDGCSSLVSLDLTGLDTSMVHFMSSMFQGCSSLSFLDLTGLKTSEVREMDDMFSRCMSLASLKTGTGWSYSRLYNDSFKPRFPVQLQDESGTLFLPGDGIPAGAHEYKAAK